MTALTTIAITLALFLGASIMIALRHYYRSSKLLTKNKALQARIDAYCNSNCDPTGTYHVRKVATKNPEYEQYNGMWGVCRMTSQRGHIFLTTIKVFTDDDNEFNHREAVELCELLNEK